MNKWLITGGCGFIGSNLTSYLFHKTNDHIVIIDNLVTGNTAALEDIEKLPGSSERLTFIQGDICNNEAIEQTLDAVDYVVHLAAQTGVLSSNEDPMYSFKVNCEGTFKLLQACLKTKPKAVVLASSGAVIGASDNQFSVSDKPVPQSIYGATKAGTEMFASAFSAAFGLNVMSLRFGNVYGPWSYAKESVIPKYIKKALNREPFEIYGDGQQTRDYIFVEDLVRAVVLALKQGASGKTYHLAGGAKTSINELVNIINESLQSQDIKGPDTKNAPVNPLEVRDSQYDISETSKELGWVPKAGLENGIFETVQWFMSNHKKEVPFSVSQ